MTVDEANDAIAKAAQLVHAIERFLASSGFRGGEK
jgi:hypothetical protein